MSYQIVESDQRAAVTLFVGGDVKVASDDHPNFGRIVDELRAGNEDIAHLFDVSHEANRRFERLSERVTAHHGQVFFDGEVVDNSLTQQVVRFLRNDEPFEPLVRFLEKVQTNANVHSREQLYDWLRDRDFTITEDGDFLAYKGVREDDEGVLRSIHAGPGIVNGVEVNGNLDNSPGNLVEIARGSVSHNPSVGCASGLHAGTYDYAASFAGHSGRVVRVRINPRDVVSVPTDSNAQKLRVCRYTVVDEVEEQDESVVYSEHEPHVRLRTQVPSRSREGVVYTQTHYRDGSVSCDCPGFRYRSYCRHGGTEDAS